MVGVDLVSLPFSIPIPTPTPIILRRSGAPEYAPQTRHRIF